MRVEIAYVDGGFTYFDTGEFTDGGALGANTALAEYDLPLDAVETEGLWLHVNRYDVDRSELDEDPTTPAARGHRRKGYRFLLAAPEEVARMQSLSIDGRMALERYGDDGCLVRRGRLDGLAEGYLHNAGILSTTAKIVDLDDLLTRLAEAAGLASIHNEERLGIENAALHHVRAADAAQKGEEL